MTVNIDNAGIVPRDDYQAALKSILAEGHCPFCEDYLHHHHKEPILWKSDHWIVTKNAWPYAGTQLHFLLITREHVERVEDLSLEAQQSFFAEYARLVEEFSLSGATILWRSGNTTQTGASVVHLHAQIIVSHPRTENSTPITAVVGFDPQ